MKRARSYYINAEHDLQNALPPPTGGKGFRKYNNAIEITIGRTVPARVVTIFGRCVIFGSARKWLGRRRRRRLRRARRGGENSI